MTAFLGKILSFLLETTAQDLETEYKQSQWNDIVGPVVKMLDNLLLPAIIIVGMAGMIFGIVLGVQYAKSEGDQKDAAKKRLINAVIGIVVALVLLIAMKIFTSQASNIASWILTEAGE